MNKAVRPNVLIFCVDEMRADHIGCAGNTTVKTPNLDNLAARGTLFTRSYCNNPICMPARASMFTGLLPRDHGVRVNGQSLRTDLPTLPGILSDHGYRTHATGKLHLTPWVPAVGEREGQHQPVVPANPDLYPESLAVWQEGVLIDFPVPYYGFQSVDFVGGHVSYAYGDYIQWLVEKGGDPALLRPEYALQTTSGAPQTYKCAMPEELHYNRYIADSTISFMAERKQNADPFFIWCSFPDPHLPIAPPRPYCDLYSPEDVDLPARCEGELHRLPPYYTQVLNGNLRPNGSDNTGITDDHWREMIAMTYGMVTHIDTEIGRVLAALERFKLRNNTLVIFLGDHGDMLGDHGLIWKGPYTFRGCINVPTIVSAPGEEEGLISDTLISQIDLLPSVLDYLDIPMPGEEWRFIDTPFERGSVMDLMPYPGTSWLPLPEGIDSKVRKSVIIENDDPTTGYRIRCIVTERYRLTVYPGTKHGELFDLREDPWEYRNLWYEQAYQQLKSELKTDLLDYYSTATPLYPIPPWNS
jgi:arylsulfatase A-like enzyme